MRALRCLSMWCCWIVRVGWLKMAGAGPVCWPPPLSAINCRPPSNPMTHPVHLVGSRTALCVLCTCVLPAHLFCLFFSGRRTVLISVCVTVMLAVEAESMPKSIYYTYCTVCAAEVLMLLSCALASGLVRRASAHFLYHSLSHQITAATAPASPCTQCSSLLPALIRWRP